MRPIVLPTVLAAATLLFGAAGADDIALNDNLIPAGHLSKGALTVALEIREGDWHLLGPGKAPGRVLAFAETGHPLQIPGPMIRVPKGTVIRATVTNRSDIALVVRGLASRRTAPMDSLLLAPGATGEARFEADAEGTYYYWAGAAGRSMGAGPLARRLFFHDSQLRGAFIVDPPGTRGPPRDRVLVLGGWIAAPEPATTAQVDNDMFVVVNGRPWPLTERLTYTVGDSIRWRIINASSDIHPLHLHGFYYRVDSRGDAAQDTTYWPAQRRMVVTERLMPGTTMSMVWSPDRPGGWVFHCHLTFHLVANPGIGPDRLSDSARWVEMNAGHPDHDPQHHVERAMGGLMMGIRVKPAPGWTAPVEVPRRTLRLLVQSDSTAADSARRFGYVLQEGSEPRRDSVPPAGATLVLHQGEPTRIWVVNRTGEPTAIHWHGIELESPYDGVVGVGGYDGSPTPTIMPEDSFEVRMTPPRSGTFMYHTHVNDLRQLRGGLWAPLLVLPPGSTPDPTHDFAFIFGEGRRGGVLPLRLQALRPIPLHAGDRYRVRLMNVSASGPSLVYVLAGEGPAPLWTPLARDGFDLPVWQRGVRRAEEQITIGETMDFEFTAPAGGAFGLEVRTAAGVLVVRQPFTITPR
jgi:FtsP/CotA-like multicopper oxidase with cupredoxin domain